MTVPLSWPDFIGRLRWLDGTPLADHIEPYRMRLFERFDERDEKGRLRYNLDLTKKIIRANPVLSEWLTIKRDVIERKDGRGFFQILAAGDVAGSHGKSYRELFIDEIHPYRNWDILEALQGDPNRRDCQIWICSYASIHHRRGTPLFDLFSIGKAGTDPRMLFSWYAADFTTDPDFEDRSPEERANPSMGSWEDVDYLEQQKRRLPAHKYRRLHLNLPGLPEGSAYQPEPILDAIDRGVVVRPPEPEITYHGYVDMSGGSGDDAVLAIAHKDAEGRAVLDRLQDQGRRGPRSIRTPVQGGSRECCGSTAARR